MGLKILSTLTCGNSCMAVLWHSYRVKRFRERHYFWIPDASLGHRNVLSV